MYLNDNFAPLKVILQSFFVLLPQTMLLKRLKSRRKAQEFIGVFFFFFTELDTFQGKQGIWRSISFVVS